MSDTEVSTVSPDRPKRPIRSSAVSQVLRAVSGEVSDARAWIIRAADGNPDFKIRVASDRISRQKAYALAYRVYRRMGYVNENNSELCVSAYDAYAGAFTLLAEDASGKECGTITMVFDSQLGLPCNEIYREEVDGLRAQGCSLVEFTRLAIDDDTPNARALLFHLFHLSYAFARCGGGCSDMLIEVNPRHVPYYQRLLRFEQAGPERPCPRVKDAPAVLLRMNFSKMEAELEGFSEGRDRTGKRIHAYMFSADEEQEVTRFLSEQHRSMSFQEAKYFKIHSGPHAAVLV